MIVILYIYLTQKQSTYMIVYKTLKTTFSYIYIYIIFVAINTFQNITPI